jgi:hypothetical protein
MVDDKSPSLHDFFYIFYEINIGMLSDRILSLMLSRENNEFTFFQRALY